MAEEMKVHQSASRVVLLLQRGLRTAAESLGLSYAMAIGPTLHERFGPMAESIGTLGFEKGWAEGFRDGWAAAPAGMIGSGVAGNIAANMMGGFMELAYGRKLTGKEAMLCKAMGAFVAVGLQVGVFSGAGMAALLTPAAGAALAYYAVASAVTSLALFAVEKPLQSISNYSKRVFDKPPMPAPA